MIWTIRKASRSDVDALYRLLRANRQDSSLFQQSRAQLEADIDSFYVVTVEQRVVGSAALIRRSDRAEILGVAVDPHHHGQGIGSALLTHLVRQAATDGVELLWLGTAKPRYFSRFGFRPMSRWRLPISLLIYKLGLVFRQPIERWLPAVFGRHVFMRYQAPNVAT